MLSPKIQRNCKNSGCSEWVIPSWYNCWYPIFKMDFLKLMKNWNKKKQSKKNLKDPKKTGQPQAFRSSCQGQLISLHLHEWVTVGKSC